MTCNPNFQRVLCGATEKLVTWHPQGIPSTEQELAEYRTLATETVTTIWTVHHRPTDLQEIYEIVSTRIHRKIKLGEWPHSQFVRSKRYVDRRVNEAASRLYAEDSIPKIVAVTSGIYQPNPKLFKDGKE